ncbi:MAG: YraN family protein [Cryomorphaceae bacterium]|jgi:putative endonuclease|nr:YraN family protein [Cryomorphaceae bacterium]
MNHQELGVFGESLAVTYLKNKGFKIIAQNVKYMKWEVDIIANFEGKIIVVEVKTRVTSEIGEPWRAVTRTKQKQIIRVAHDYLTRNDCKEETRFDVVSIVHNSFRTDIEHIEDAFYPIS